MNSLEYQLTIKSANQKVDDYSLICRSSWTVARLKQHISETHVNKPNVGDQRLIYAGNLLKDSLTLKQVFFRDSLCTELTNSSKTDFTIHLVCSTSAQRSQTTTSTSPRTSSGNTIGSDQAVNQTRNHQATPPSTGPSSNQPPAVPDGGTNNQNITGSSNSHAPTATPPSQTINGDQAVPPLANAAISNTHAYLIAQRLLQTDQVRQQLAMFQQLADLVATELAQNLAINSNLAASSPLVDSNATREQSPLRVPSTISSVLSSQVLNLPTNATADATTARTHNNGNNLAAHSIATQILYANHLNQPGALPQNGHNIGGNNNNINGPRVDHQAQAAAAVAVAGPQQQAQVPQAPIIDQPVPAQPIDPAPGLQRDVIDWVYYSIRALILMVALYIHASLFRLLFIVGLLGIAYFFNRRSARRQNLAPAAAAAPPRPAAPPAEPHLDHPVDGEAADGVARENDGQDQNGQLRRRQVAGAGEEQAAEGNHAGDNQSDGAHGPERAEAAVGGGDLTQGRVSFLKLCYLVVTDFLASLVPE